MYAEILSPSKMKKYLECPEQYWHKMEGTTERPSFGWRVGSCFHQAIEVYVKSKYQFTFEQAMDWGIANIEAFDAATRKEAMRIGLLWLETDPLPRISQVVGTEESFGPPGTAIRGKPVHIGVEFDSGLKIRGIIDLVWEDANTIVVGDYKTGWEYMDDEMLSTKVQAMAYALAVHKLTHGNREIRVEFYQIRYPDGGPVTWAPEEQDYEEIENYLAALQRRILNDETHEPIPSLDCRYCPFNYTCEAFDLWSHTKPPNMALWHTLDLPDLISLYDVWNERFLSNKRVNDDLKDIIVEVMSREFVDQVKLPNGAGFKINRKATKKWDKEVQPILDENNGKMPPNRALELSQYQRTTYGRPYLQRIGRKKKE